VVVRHLTRASRPVRRALWQGVTKGDGVRTGFAGETAEPLSEISLTASYAVPLRHPRHCRERENKERPAGRAFGGCDGVRDRLVASTLPPSPPVTFHPYFVSADGVTPPSGRTGPSPVGRASEGCKPSRLHFGLQSNPAQQFRNGCGGPVSGFFFSS
jgi:hypothetical protein